MRFEPDDTSVMVLLPLDQEAKDIKALERRLAELFPRQASYILQNACNKVAHGKTGDYKATGLKDVYKFIVDTNSREQLKPEQHRALRDTKKFIRKFDQSWQPPKR